ncbi:hypothetical protein [uncultured Rhodospira sp.]|uniref:hypothetical protein n=1 Tax=uncultured Rhodospira sp. TaxID=1936189 RepID=UPI00260FA61E|nr:hypothetical protein [uncultured Rhodospira sp.]
MPSVLTHTAIMLLARERLGQVERVLSSRIAAAPDGQTATDVEVRLRDLARAALEVFKTTPHVDAHVPGNLAGQTVADSLSKFAVMGAMGPDIPAFAQILRPGQGWLFDTIHKGTPDTHRERMRAGTSTLALSLFAKGRDQITGAYAGGDRTDPMNKLKAFVLGHLCHGAGDIISHPLINDIEWHLGTDGRRTYEHHDAEGALDALVAQRVFGRAGVRAGGGWDAWWPTKDEVPPELYGAYADALEEVYTARSERPTGFNPFEDALAALDPPVADAAFIQEGYETYRRAVISVVYELDWGDWSGVLSAVALPLIALPFLFLALPDTRPLAGLSFEETEEGHEDRLAFNLVTLPMLIGSGSAVGLQAWVMSLASKGVEDRMLFGLIAAILMTVFLVLFLIEGGVRAWPKGARWSILFGLPLVLMTVLAGFALYDLDHDGLERRSAATIIPVALAFGPMVAFLALFGIFTLILWGVNGLTGLAGAEFDFKAASFWTTTVIWLAGVITLWVLGGKWLRDIRIPEEPDHFLARQRHAVRLFDDDAMAPDLDDDGNPVDDQTLYPAGRRKLARLWWTGGGTMQVRSDRYGLTFRPEGGDEQAVPAPLAPMRLSEYLDFLTATVQDSGGATGSLNAAPVDEENDVFLPPGATFAAHGDAAETEEAIREQSAVFKDLGSEDDEDDAYALYHAPKSWQSVRAGKARIMPRPFADIEAAAGAFETAQGYAYVVEPGRQDSEDSIMALAGDFAAMLCLGAMGHIDPPAPDPLAAGADEPRVYQVFRNWNLDRRRVNEWRLLVSGNARTEKTAAEAYDGALPPAPYGPNTPATWEHPMGAGAAIAAADTAARGLGWVPMLRTWLERIADPNTDALDETDPGDDTPPTRTLSRAMAYLFDRPDPSRPPPGGP